MSVPTSIQVALFLPEPERAEVTALACFPSIELTSSLTQGELSVAEFRGEITRRVNASKGNGRTDIHWEAPTGPPRFEEDEIDLSALDADFDNISKYVAKMPIGRIGVIVRSRQAVGESGEGVAKVVEAIPGLPVPDRSTELTYRLNVPTEKDGLILNRICVWQTGKIAVLKMSQMGSSQKESKHFVEFQVDVNSSSDMSIDPGKAEDVFSAIRKEALRLIGVGMAGL